MRRPLLTAAALMLLTTIAPAKDLLTSGYWTSFAVNGQDSKTPMCGMTTTITNSAQTASGMIMVKFQRGADHLFIQLYKTNWKFRSNNVPVKATVSFDGTRLNAEGTAYVKSGPDGEPTSYVEFTVHPSYTGGFIAEFSESNRMLIEFVDGDEPNWSSSLIGSRNVASVFADCVRYYGGIPRAPEGSTQPFNTDRPKVAPTQPFDSNGQPTVPAPQAKDAANALELKCSAPRVALGDELDENPVVAVEIKYKPDDHAWRIFHHLRNGLIVARNEQYAIQDWTNNGKTHWSGSLIRNRNLVMVGEVRRSADNSTFSIWRGCTIAARTVGWSWK